MCAALSGALLLSTGLAACGGDDTAAEAPPAPASSSTTPESTSATPTPTPSPTPTLRPLSRFEDRPQVKVARNLARAAALAVNKGDKSMTRIRPFVTDAGLKNFQRYFNEDFPNLFPGPLPFTPVGVRDLGGGRAEVPMCVWLQGFTVDRKSKAPVKSRDVEAGKFTLVRAGGKWRVEDMIGENRSCEKTVVKGRPF
ncbi:hypothetical protein GCM10009815_33590 [Nocardioides marmoribigeumensis]